MPLLPLQHDFVSTDVVALVWFIAHLSWFRNLNKQKTKAASTALNATTSLSADWFYCAAAFQILTQFNSLSLQKTKAAIRCPIHFHQSLISLEKVPVSARES